jgi:hypothetical protein|tara:strand:- start:378 stop:680 length:303 start_codon:yes stop_codon:yes gene_type:complete
MGEDDSSEKIGFFTVLIVCIGLIFLSVYVSKYFYFLAIPLTYKSLSEFIKQPPNFLKSSKRKRNEKELENIKIEKIKKEKSDMLKDFMKGIKKDKPQNHK